MQRHGWVVPLPGGVKAKCGGPSICPQCKREKEAADPRLAEPDPAVVSTWDAVVAVDAATVDLFPAADVSPDPGGSYDGGGGDFGGGGASGDW